MAMKLAAAFVACLLTGVNGQAGFVSDIPDTVCADIADSDSATPGVQPDGRVGVDDLLVVLANFRRTGSNTADLNGDQGKLNIFTFPFVFLLCAMINTL